jgi:hypothetical protein
LRAIAQWSETSPDFDWRAGRCYQPPRSSDDFSPECTPRKRPGVPLVLLWGDSHAADLYPGLVSAQSTQSFDIAQWTAAGCPPAAIPFTNESLACAGRRATALKELTHFNPDVILLAGAWELYLDLGQSEGDIVRALTETIRQLQKDGSREIVVFGPGPLWNTTLAIDLFRFMLANRVSEVPERLERKFVAAWHLDAAMAAQATAMNFRYVSVLGNFCNKSGCRTVGDRSSSRPDLLYYDRGHLTVSGSKDLIAHSNLHF